MKAWIDDNVRIVRLVEGLTSVGLMISNDREGGLRIHVAESLAQVIDLQERRERDAETDRQIRAGMRHLALVDNGPGAT